MRYVDFRDVIHEELRQAPTGFTWSELRERLDLPYRQPCPTWVRRLEDEIGLSRSRGSGRAYVWTLGGQKEIARRV